MKTVYQLIADGVLPMPESTHYPLADAATAMRVMSGAQHTGKLVLDVTHTGRSRVTVPPAQARVFRRDGAYIITGGLGGLGLFLAEKMAVQVRAGSAGAAHRVVLALAANPEALADNRAHPRDRCRRRGGVRRYRRGWHCAAVGRHSDRHRTSGARRAACGSGVRERHTDQHHRRAHRRDWAPKVYGAWNLHCALQEAHAEQPLDWFCSFSSAAALVGAAGEGAYAAANSWLDAFTLWRRTQGLPASAIAWGVWAEVGRATVAEGRRRCYRSRRGAYAFEALLRHDRG